MAGSGAVETASSGNNLVRGVIEGAREWLHEAPDAMAKIKAVFGGGAGGLQVRHVGLGLVGVAAVLLLVSIGSMLTLLPFAFLLLGSLLSSVLMGVLVLCLAALVSVVGGLLYYFSRHSSSHVRISRTILNHTDTIATAASLHMLSPSYA